MERFWSKVFKEHSPGGCWNWTAAKRERDYGYFWLNGKGQPAHRVSYVFEVGEIPDGLVLDHRCNNHSCVNPLHLEPVTQRVNVLRGSAPTAVNAAKEFGNCGHPLFGENVYITPSGSRDCRLCIKLRMARFLDRKKNNA